MKSVGEFLEQCISMSAPLPPLDVALDGASGCILAEPVLAPADIPGRTEADGDGYAVLASDVAAACVGNPVELAVTDAVAVTAVSGGVLVPGACVRVASGAPLPAGADAVVPLSGTDHGAARVRILQAVAVGENVRQVGQDVRAGAELLPAGVRIGSRQVALLAGAGYATVRVHPAPRVVIIAVGDELQEAGRRGHVGGVERQGAVYDASSHALASALREAGAQVFRVGVVSDSKAVLREVIEDQLVRADIVITTGGLSYGGGDTVKEVLASFGAHSEGGLENIGSSGGAALAAAVPVSSVRFDNVAIWPGRQFGVGTLAGVATVFCLPGNPMAALTAYEVFIRPALRTMAGYKHVHRPLISVRLSADWEGDAELEEFVPVRVLGNPSDGYEAELLVDPGVTALSALAQANGLAVVPVGQKRVPAGSAVNCVIIDR